MEDRENKPNERGFTVTDRRRFTDSGDTRDAGDAASTSRAEYASESAGRRGEPPVSFSSFVLGLSTQALMALGEVEDPGTHATTTDLAAARQLIDILGVLQDKTRNNLDEHEHALLESALYDLRVRFVALVRKGQGAKEER